MWPTRNGFKNMVLLFAAILQDKEFGLQTKKQSGAYSYTFRCGTSCNKLLIYNIQKILFFIKSFCVGSLYAEGQLYVMKGNFKRKIKLTLKFIGIFAGNI